MKILNKDLKESVRLLKLAYEKGNKRALEYLVEILNFSKNLI